MSISLLITFLIPTLALNLTPGPDMFFVISQSSKGGIKAATKAALGLWIGYLFHIALVSAGLAALLTKYPQAFVLMKFLGASYLLILGVKLLMKKNRAETIEKKESSLLEGIFVSALNPKVAIFFLAFLPQFIDHAKSPALQLLMLGLIFSFTSTLVNMGAGSLVYLLKKGGAATGKKTGSLNRICGVVMMGMAAKLAFTR